MKKIVAVVGDGDREMRVARMSVVVSVCGDSPARTSIYRRVRSGVGRNPAQVGAPRRTR